MSSKPRRLYKYVFPERTDVLESRSIRLTPPSGLNDPFELFLTHDAHLRPLIGARIIKRLKRSYRSRTLAVMDDILGGDARDLGLHAMVGRDLRDDDSELVRAMRKAVRQTMRSQDLGRRERHAAISKLKDRLDREYGVLCLTERADDLLMWSHYAASHRGFVLEFDAEHPFFDRKEFPGDPLRCVRKVRYQDRRPPGGRFDEKYWLRSPSRAVEDLLTFMTGLLLLTKSADWAYEREWRMIAPLVWAETTLEKDGEEIHLLALPPGCVRGVILGSAMRDETRQRICELLQQPDYSHVELRRAERDARSFQVAVRDDPSVLENRLLEDVGAFPQAGIQERIQRLRVSGPRFYAAERALVEQGLIVCPPYDRSRQRKRLLALSDAGRARLATRREAACALEEADKSDFARFLDAQFAGGVPSSEEFEQAFVEFMRPEVTAVVEEAVAAAESGKGEKWRIPDLFSSLSDEDEETRWNAAASLREIGDGAIVEHLISILQWRRHEELAWLQDVDPADEPDPYEVERVEAEAPVAYWMLGDRTTWGQTELSRLAAFALAGIVARITAIEAVEPLIETLGEDDEEVRFHAAEALGRLGSAAALPKLRRLVEQDDGESPWGRVADAARIAIRRIEREQERIRFWER